MNSPSRSSFIVRCIILAASLGGAGGAFVWVGPGSLATSTLSVSSIFSAMLTLAAFLFTARHIVIFELQKNIYGQPNYREHLKKLADPDVDVGDIYKPLQTLNRRIVHSTWSCFVSAMLLLPAIYWPANCFPLVSRILQALAIGSLIWTAGLVLWMVNRIDANMKAIINYWKQNPETPAP